MQKKQRVLDNMLPNPKLYNLPFTVDQFQGMPYKRYGSTGLKVSAVGLGTWKFGYPETGDGSRVSEKTAFKILDKAIDQGVTFWDTANRYNNSSGNSERILGKWFRDNPGQRRNVELATKIFGTMDGTTPNFCRLSRLNILEATYASLERLQTDRVEIMQFHWYDDTTPIEESLTAIEDLIRQDLVRYFGVSNFNLGQVEQYSAFSEEFPRAKIQSVQNQFDILYGEDPARKGVLEYCAQKQITFIAWSPLRSGLLSGRYLDKSQVKAGDRLFDENRLKEELTEPILEKLHELAALAREWGITLTQLAIAFMTQIPAMGPVIAACTTPEQCAENAAAGKVVLSAEQVQALAQLVQ